jgi:hypothetical protein
MDKLKVLFKKVNAFINPLKGSVKFNPQAVLEIRSRITSLCWAIRDLMKDYHLIDNATENDDRFTPMCQMLLEKMVSYIILLNVAKSEIQARETYTTMSSFVNALTQIAKKIFNLSDTKNVEGVKFTIGDLCDSFRHKSLFDDGQSHNWNRPPQHGGSVGNDLGLMLQTFAGLFGMLLGASMGMVGSALAIPLMLFSFVVVHSANTGANTPISPIDKPNEVDGDGAERPHWICGCHWDESDPMVFGRACGCNRIHGLGQLGIPHIDDDTRLTADMFKDGTLSKLQVDALLKANPRIMEYVL